MDNSGRSTHNKAFNGSGALLLLPRRKKGVMQFNSDDFSSGEK